MPALLKVTLLALAGVVLALALTDPGLARSDSAIQAPPREPWPEYPGYVAFSFAAHFVEVRVEPGTRRIRVPRVVSVPTCQSIACRSAKGDLR